MPSTQSPRLLFVHAHPDDEALGTGATIAYYASRGADVRVVTCTLGEEGEVIGDRYALLAVDHADQLGGYRIAELTEALSILGAGQPMFLGGPGRWRDSGMAGTPPRRHTRFIDAGDAAVGELVDIIGRFRPHVVVTYDPEGGYGHPDHVHTHTVTTAAVTASAQSGWAVPKFYWTVLSTSAMTAALAGQTVLLIDGDLRRSSLALAIGVADHVGLSEILLGQAEAAEAIHPMVSLAGSPRAGFLSLRPGAGFFAGRAASWRDG